MAHHRASRSDWVPGNMHDCLTNHISSPATFRRVLRNGKSCFTVMSLHFSNKNAKERGIAKNVFVAVRTVVYQEQVDMQATSTVLHVDENGRHY